MRPAEKTRIGSKLHRRYGQTTTPYQRLLDSGQLSTKPVKICSLNTTRLAPKKLMQIIQEKQQQLLRILRKSDAQLRHRTQPRSVTSLLTAVRLPR